MHFTSIKQIRAHKWVGNAMSDSPAFAAVDGFARDSSANTVADRAEALRVMCRNGMGLTDEAQGIVGQSDQEQLDEYIALCDE